MICWIDFCEKNAIGPLIPSTQFLKRKFRQINEMSIVLPNQHLSWPNLRKNIHSTQKRVAVGRGKI